MPDDACEQAPGQHLLATYQQIAADAGAHFKDVAEGNPLHVEEILAMLVDDGLLRNSEGRWVLATDALTTIVPPTIQALLAARLDRLPRPRTGLSSRAGRGDRSRLLPRPSRRAGSPAAVRPAVG